MIHREMVDEVCILHMRRGRGNALSPDFLAALQEEVQRLRAEPPRGVVLTGEGAIFSAGLDIPALLPLDRKALRSALHLLYGVCRGLFAFPRPVVAAVNGHAVAGGALLALACDVRFMAQGEGRFGLNESTVGLSIPPSLVELCRYTLDRPLLEKLMYGGVVYPAFKAFDMGILDDLVDEEDLLARACEAVERWTASRTAFAEIKSRLKAPALEAMAAAHLEDEAWLRLWHRPETQERLRALVDKLEHGRKPAKEDP